MDRLIKLGKVLVVFAFLGNLGPAHGDTVCPIGKSATINYIKDWGIITNG